MATPTQEEVLSGKDSGASTVTLTTAAGTAVDDILIAIELSDFYTGPIPDPTGTWTLIDNADLGANQIHLRAWWRKVTSSGANAVVFNKITDEDIDCYLYRLRGADTTAPIDAHASGTGTGATSHVAPACSPSSSDAFLICAYGSGNGTYTAVAGGMTQDGNVDGSPFNEMMCAHQALVASGSTGTKTATFDTARDYTAISIAVKGASAAAVTAYAAPYVGPAPGRISPSGIWTPAPRSTDQTVNPTAETTTAAGVANDATVDVAVNAGTTSATGTAFDATVDVGVLAETTSASATANDPYLSGIDPTAAPYTGPAPGRLSPSGVWTVQPGDPSATGAGVLVVSAEATSATGTAFDASVDVGLSAETTSAAGVALAAVADVALAAGTPAAVGTAFDATVAVTVNAEATTATGTALAGAADLAVPAEATAATGTANAVTVALGVLADVAGATGTAYDATVTGTGTGIAPAAECATATGTAYDATVEIVNARTGGSWDTLVNLSRQAADEYRAARRATPLACPNCGEPLDGRPGSPVLHCPPGDYEWPRDRPNDSTWG